MSFLSRAVTGVPEKRILDSAPWIGNPYDSMSVQGWATMPGEHTREGDSMALGAFYACVTLLADIISSLPLKAYRKRDNVDTECSPQPDLFKNGPFPEITWFSWLWMFMESLAVTGNGIGYIPSFDNKMGNATSILPIHPSFVAITESAWEGTKWPKPLYTVLGEEIPNDRIFHIKRYPLAAMPWGMSPVEKAASAIGLGLASQRYGLRYFQDAANPSGILTSDQDLSPQQAAQNQKRWIQSHQGRRLPAILSGGLTWQSVTLTPEESQFLTTREFQVEEVARWFRIPPHMIGATGKSTSWGSGLAEQTLGFVKYTLMPWLVCIEQAITQLLPRGQFAKFDLDELLRADIVSRWEAYRLGRDSGAYSVNDIRAKEDMPKIGKEGDIHLQPANFVPLGTPPPTAASPANQQPSEPFQPKSNKPAEKKSDDGDD